MSEIQGEREPGKDKDHSVIILKETGGGAEGGTRQRTLVSTPDPLRLVRNLDVKNNISRLSKQSSQHARIIIMCFQPGITE